MSDIPPPPDAQEPKPPHAEPHPPAVPDAPEHELGEAQAAPLAAQEPHSAPENRPAPAEAHEAQAMPAEEPVSPPAVDEVPPFRPAPPPAPPPPPAPQARSGSGALLGLFALGFLVLAGGLYWVWSHPQAAGGAATRLDAAEQQVSSLGQQVTALEQRVDALEKRGPGAAEGAPDLSAVSGRLDQLTSRLDALAQQEKADAADLSGRVSHTEQAAGAADHAARFLRLMAAREALAAGQKLGDIPDAPPALARFADTAPPTEATLRRAFPAVVEAARAAGAPEPAGKQLLDRMWDRMQRSITIRHGDTVLIGDRSAVALGHAQAALEAGDLAGAVAALDGLTGPAAQAAQSWADQARALLAARAALADLMAHA
ncbi:MAG TPA: mitofilin family membrane protein [Acetobacteraceae bacterium]|nr:mitofilin family membrane protein [Acetobacteraceae bacterium]